MKEVFGDTFFFLAIANPADRAHARARAFGRDRSRRLVTTSWVLTEVGDALAAPGNRERFLELLELLGDDPAVVVLGASQPLFLAGVDLFRNRPDKSWPLTDCISFAVMKQRGIEEALTGDRHFEQAGFVALLS